MDFPECYSKATEWVEGLLQNVHRASLDDPTTCAEWKVRDLLNHLIGGNYFFASVVNRDSAPVGEPPDFAEGELVDAYRKGAEEMKLAMAKPGNLDGTVSPPFGEMPATAFCGIAFSDQLTHGWDLAKSTNQGQAIPDDLLAVADAFVRQALGSLDRNPHSFDRIVELPDDASKQDKFVAFLGRQP